MPITSVPSSHQISYMGVQALKSSHPQVRKLKRQQQGHSAHGNKVWRSSFVLMDYLSDQAIPQHSRVLDIGCGWGLTAIYLAKQFNANVTGIDIDASVEPFLTLQAEINDCQISFQRRSFESLTKSELAKYHSLIGTDICFWDELTVPLFNVIRRAISAGCQNIYIADPGRPPFWSLADQCVAKLGADVISRSIEHPWKTEKYILRLGGE